jgi:hypothetical protein
LPSLKRAGKKPCLDQDGLLPRAREGFCVRKDEGTHESLPSLKRAGKKPGGLEQDGLLLSRAREGFCVRKDEESIPYLLSKIVVRTGKDEGPQINAWELCRSRAREAFCVRQDGEPT